MTLAQLIRVFEKKTNSIVEVYHNEFDEKCVRIKNQKGQVTADFTIETFTLMAEAIV